MLEFQSVGSRSNFEQEFRRELLDHHIALDLKEGRLSALKKSLFTRAKRNTVLEKFFKQVFSEVCLHLYISRFCTVMYIRLFQQNTCATLLRNSIIR